MMIVGAAARATESSARPSFGEPLAISKPFATYDMSMEYTYDGNFSWTFSAFLDQVKQRSIQIKPIAYVAWRVWDEAAQRYLTDWQIIERNLPKWSLTAINLKVENPDTVQRMLKDLPELVLLFSIDGDPKNFQATHFLKVSDFCDDSQSTVMDVTQWRNGCHRPKLLSCESFAGDYQDPLNSQNTVSVEQVNCDVLKVRTGPHEVVYATDFDFHQQADGTFYRSYFDFKKLIIEHWSKIYDGEPLSPRAEWSLEVFQGQTSLVEKLFDPKTGWAYSASTFDRKIDKTPKGWTGSIEDFFENLWSRGL
jgi:hypothetical protein